MNVFMYATIAAIWIVLFLVIVTGAFLIRKVYDIQNEKLDKVDFIEFTTMLYKEKQKERKLP